MYKLFTFLVLFLTTLSMQGQDHSLKEFPPYAEIFEKLIEQEIPYSIKQGDFTRATPYKKQDGYWVSIHTYNSELKEFEETETKLFWSTKNGYQTIVFDTNKSTKQQLSNTTLGPKPQTKSHLDKFNIHPLYNYEGWEDDVIAYYDRDDLTAAENYSLGRAYSQKGTFFSKEVGKIINIIDEKEKQAKLTEVATLLDKSAEYFKKCHDLNPNFETIVGRIYTKYCNEIMMRFIKTCFLDSKEHALTFLKDKKLYTEATLAYSKNYLESCDKDAILITYGDNDTYPLLYLQFTQNFRKDVLIINSGIMNVDYYINHLRDKTFYKNSLVLDVPAAFYAGEKNDYVYFSNESTEITPIKSLVKILDQPTNTSTPNKIPSTQLLLSGPNKEQNLKLNCEANYLVKGDLAILLLLEANKNKRAIHFTPSFGFGNNLTMKHIGLSPYLHLNGMTFQVKYGYTSGKPITNIDTDDNFEIMQSKLKWEKMTAIHSENLSAFQSYKYANSMVISALLEKNEIGKATEMLEDFFEIFETPMKDLDTRDALIYADMFFRVDNIEKGQTMVEELLNQMKGKKKLSMSDYQAVKFAESILNRKNINKFDRLLEEINKIPRERNN